MCSNRVFVFVRYGNEMQVDHLAKVLAFPDTAQCREFLTTLNVVFKDDPKAINAKASLKTLSDDMS